jgi:hypothetical protein
MKTFNGIIRMSLTAALLAALALPAMAGEVKVSYLYKLSDFMGVIPYSAPRISVDREKNEIFVVSGSEVSIFNSAGMETSRIDYDPEIGSIIDLTPVGDGNVVAIIYKGATSALTLCNYRLEPQRTIQFRNFPPEFVGFNPSQVRHLNGRLYMASNSAMKIVVMDLNGEFVKGYDLVAILGDNLIDKDKNLMDKSKHVEKSSEQKRADNGFEGFNLDAEGNLLFVLPVLGKAGRLTPDGTAVLFGKRGSGVGKFGIPGGIVADGSGNYLVSDKLRNMVIVFGGDLEFVKEFGAAGGRDAYLVGPTDMAVAGDGKLYVGQYSSRGVNVYQLEQLN